MTIKVAHSWNRPANVDDYKVDRSANGCICLASGPKTTRLPRDSELSCQGAAYQHQVAAGIRCSYRLQKIVLWIRQRLEGGDQNWHILRFAARHHRGYRHVLHGNILAAGAYLGRENHLRAEETVSKHLLVTRGGRRDKRQAISYVLAIHEIHDLFHIRARLIQLVVAQRHGV